MTLSHPDLLSSLEAKDDLKHDRNFDPNSTPPKRAKPSASIPQTQRERLLKFDGGHCFVTNASDSPNTVQCAHIATSATATSDDEVSNTKVFFLVVN